MPLTSVQRVQRTSRFQLQGHPYTVKIVLTSLNVKRSSLFNNKQQLMLTTIALGLYETLTSTNLTSTGENK